MSEANLDFILQFSKPLIIMSKAYLYFIKSARLLQSPLTSEMDKSISEVTGHWSSYLLLAFIAFRNIERAGKNP